jgi:hypothetical protein
MTAEESKETDKAKSQVPDEINFKCPSCNHYKPLEEMRIITRFFPLITVCPECEKKMR